jgi:hypothetical protein
MNHPDFRVAGKIFATLDYPGPGWAVVMLTPEDQAAAIRLQPQAFAPVKGKWGEQGATSISLRQARVPAVRDALAAAYEARKAKTEAKSRTGRRQRG